MNIQLTLDYLRCQRIIRKHSATFFLAFSQLKDPSRRRGIYAVYAFCRYVDDIIDEYHDLSQLLAYKSELDDLVKGFPVKGFRWRALADTTKRFYQDETNFKPFYEMIEGQEWDANPVRIQTLPQLIQYCDLVASSVGKMLIPILAPGQTQQLNGFANHLGRAFQLTNILRDVGEDFRNNRVYLPATLMLEYGYSIDDLKQQTINPSFISLWEALASQAETYYAEALKDLHHFPKDAQFPLLASLTFYQAILASIRKAGYTVMDRKHYVSDQDKVLLMKKIKKEGNLQ